MDTSETSATRSTSATSATPVGAPAPRDGLLPLRRYTWWSLVAGFGILLVLPLIGWALERTLAPGWQLLGWVSAAGVAAASLVLIQRRLPLNPRPNTEHTDGPPQLPIGWVVGGGTAGIVLAVILRASGEDIFWTMGPAIVVAMAITYVDRGTARWIVASSLLAAVALGLGLSVALDGDVRPVGPIWGAAVVLFACSMSIASLWSWQVAAALDDARRVAGDMAVAEERLRFAADLHDIQGHHLQVIALKSELASRLVGSDAAAAADQMREVQQLAAEALRDTREVVYDLRRTSLDAEIANATGVLAAADIDGRMQLDPALDRAELSETSRHLLGLVVREAVTNILRHSEAGRADVRLRREGDTVHLEVSNDGVGAGDRDPGDAHRPDRAPSGGLTMLAARLADADGSLTWHLEAPSFVLRAALPMRRDAGVPA